MRFYSTRDEFAKVDRKTGLIAALKPGRTTIEAGKEVLKGILIGGAITAGIAIITIATAGALAPAIAVALVGSNFAGLGGAALTNACLAYLGGGAIAIGGTGIAGGTIAIVGGGAVLGIGAGLGVGGAVGAAGILGKQNTILQSAKLLVSVREIFLKAGATLSYMRECDLIIIDDVFYVEPTRAELQAFYRAITFLK